MTAVLRASLVLLALSFAMADVCAQDTASARALASNYQLADAVGERRCPIVLEARTAAPGFALVFDKAVCIPLFGYLAEVTAWQPAPAGGIYLVNGKGTVIAEFTEGVGGVYEAIRENDGVYFLSNLRVADPGTFVQLTDMVGDWNLRRPQGPPLCRITLTDEPAGEERFALRVGEKCDAAITSFGPVAWRLDRGDLVLISGKDERLRFGRNDEGAWSKVPDRPRPLLMTRPN
jgi:hypothetical protein